MCLLLLFPQEHTPTMLLVKTYRLAKQHSKSLHAFLERPLHSSGQMKSLHPFFPPQEVLYLTAMNKAVNPQRLY